MFIFCLSVDITLYAFFIQVIIQGCKDNKMMKLLNEGKKTRCNKRSRKHGNMSKTLEKKESNTSCFRSVRNRKVPARYLDYLSIRHLIRLWSSLYQDLQCCVSGFFCNNNTLLIEVCRIYHV
jgi:hypothetical protein